MIKDYTPEHIRNVSLIGHSGTGKTTITEAILYLTNTIKEKGSVEQGNTVSDFDEDEKKKKFSIKNSVAFVERNDVKVNLLDTPGMADFLGEILSALAVSESAVMVVDAVDGIQMETPKIWRYADRFNLARCIYINKIDKERANFNSVVESLKEKFGKNNLFIVPIHIPIGLEAEFKGVVDVVKMKALLPDKGGKALKEQDIPDDMKDAAEEARVQLIEAVAEVDDALMEKYLEGNEIATDEIHKAVRLAVKERKVIPITCGVTTENINVMGLYQVIEDYMPSPADADEFDAHEADAPDKKMKKKYDASLPFSAFVYKTRIDQFAGRQSYFKVMTGEVNSDDEIFLVKANTKEKPGHIYGIIGNKQVEVNKLVAGDIGCIAKVDSLSTFETFCDPKNTIQYPPIKLPQPVFSLAYNTENKSDEDKAGTVLNRFAEEDPTFIKDFNAETKENVISGMGEMQINVILDNIKEKNKINILTRSPKIAYQETITKKAKAEYKHKKQSGGRGQYGHVLIEIAPLERGKGFEFVDKIVGGRIPKNYIPGVEKGLKEGMEEGVLAKYPQCDVQVTLYDGSFHEVDSSELAFKIAALQALKKAVTDANPILLEPIMNVEVFSEKDLTGDILSDLQSRRGRVLGMGGDEGEESALQTIKAQVPLSELMKYPIELKALTSGRASFEMEFSHYEPITDAQLKDKIIQDAQSEEE